LLGEWAGGEPRLLAAALIVALTVINHFGVRIAGWLQVTVTVVPILVLLVVCVYVLGDSGAGQVLREQTTATPKGGGGGYTSGDTGGLAALGHAYLKVYFAYSGWNAALYVAG